MRKESKEHVAQYRPMPYEKRFWVFQQDCYTEAELTFRRKILEFRKKSKLSPELLNNPSSWFSEKENALINMNDKAYVFSNAYKPEHSLSREDFQVQPIDEQRLQWPLIDDLMQETGDYLLLRNQNLPQEQLNQPMNYVLLDINYMLRDLSQNPNTKQVMEQLEHLNAYINKFERHSSNEGSDKLFLANLRFAIDKKIQPSLTYQMESKLLKDKLQEMSKTARKLSTERNRILHFALSTNSVNPHSYDFTMDAIENTKAYPTQAAKSCSLSPRSISNKALSGSELKDCPNFNLIDTSETVLSHYSKAIKDLDELAGFQAVISKITNLLGQAGEFYTLSQFKNQMLALLKQMDLFLDESSHPIEELIEANTYAYHWAIQREQNLGVYERRFTSEPTKLKNFIINHDTLAQYPSSISDLSKTAKAIKEQIAEVTTHLSRQKVTNLGHEDILEQSQELNNIMKAMHIWVKTQFEKKGLAPPTSPRPLFFEANIPNKIIERKVIYPFFSQNANLFIPPKSTTLPQCPDSDQACQRGISAQNNNNAILGFGFIFSFGIALIALYLLFKWLYKKFDIDKEENTQGELSAWPNISF